LAVTFKVLVRTSAINITIEALTRNRTFGGNYVLRRAFEDDGLTLLGERWRDRGKGKG
jgi:hypothetical protein